MQAISYLFSPVPGIVFNYINHLLIYSGVLVLLGIILKVLFIIRKNNKALKRTLKAVPSQFIWCGITLAILGLSRTNGVAFLSMRALLFVFIALSIYYIGKAGYKMIKVYPEMKKLVEKPDHKEEKVKYSTKKKK